MSPKRNDMHSMRAELRQHLVERVYTGEKLSPEVLALPDQGADEQIRNWWAIEDEYALGREHFIQAYEFWESGGFVLELETLQEIADEWQALLYSKLPDSEVTEIIKQLDDFCECCFSMGWRLGRKELRGEVKSEDDSDN